MEIRTKLLRCRQLASVVFMPISYLLTGDPWRSYKSIIDDCINVFSNIPEMYRMRTDVGSRRQSLVTVADYGLFMQNSIRRLEAGLSLDTDAWMDDGNLAVISLLYDIVVCVYSVQNKRWYVFNEAGTRGFVLLLNTPGHFDVMKGVLPHAAHTHAVSRQSIGASNEIWQILQQQYSFDFVNALPEHFAGINILNNAVVQVMTAPNET